jgi:uncharacterized phage-associated protein
MFDRDAPGGRGLRLTGSPYAERMPVSASAVAAALRERLPGLPTKKLHKLLYFCQGHHLAAFGHPLFSETISAWDRGPVVGQLWYSERQGGALAIGEQAGARLDEGALNTVGYVVSRYGALTGRDLENLTHAETPWQRADEQRRPGESARIELEWLTEYFSSADDDEEDSTPLDGAVVRSWLRGAESRRASPAKPDSLDELRARMTRSA